MQVVPYNKKGGMNATAAKYTNAMTCLLKLIAGFQQLQDNTSIRLTAGSKNEMFYNTDILTMRAQRLVSTATGQKVILSSAYRSSISGLDTSDLVNRKRYPK
jgi:hypothetical protein